MGKAKEISKPRVSYGACVFCCGKKTQRGSCKTCGVSGLCETCLGHPCPTHRAAASNGDGKKIKATK